VVPNITFNEHHLGRPCTAFNFNAILYIVFEDMNRRINSLNILERPVGKKESDGTKSRHLSAYLSRTSDKIHYYTVIDYV
jgi:hypothetical protein